MSGRLVRDSTTPEKLALDEEDRRRRLEHPFELFLGEHPSGEIQPDPE
jgi:hypothetical protein